MIKGYLIYIRNTNCNVCGSRVIYYLKFKKIICDCADVEVELSDKMLKEHFKTFDKVLRELIKEKGE